MIVVDVLLVNTRVRSYDEKLKVAMERSSWEILVQQDNISSIELKFILYVTLLLQVQNGIVSSESYASHVIFVQRDRGVHQRLVI